MADFHITNVNQTLSEIGLYHYSMGKTIRTDKRPSKWKAVHNSIVHCEKLASCSNPVSSEGPNSGVWSGKTRALFARLSILNVLGCFSKTDT